MTLSDLKTGFFGYKKASVYQYITDLEEQFSTKLVEKDEELKKVVEQYEQKLQRLEEELSEARKQFEAKKNEQGVIADALIEAQRYAQQMRQEAEEKRREAQQSLEEETARQNQALERYRDQIRQLREAFAAMLNEMDAAANHLEHKAETTQAESPEPNLSLFRRKTGPVA